MSTVVHRTQMQAIRDGKEYICEIHGHTHVPEIETEQSSCNWGCSLIARSTLIRHDASSSFRGQTGELNGASWGLPTLHSLNH